MHRKDLHRIKLGLLPIMLGLSSNLFAYAPLPLASSYNDSQKDIPLFSSLTPLFATLFWIGGNGQWSNDANWTGGVEPTSTDFAIIDAAVTVDITNYAAAAQGLNLDSGATLLVNAGGSLTTGYSGSFNDLIIGNLGAASLQINGGTVNSESAVIGLSSTGIGAASITSGGVWNSNFLTVGYGGTGTLNIVDGTLNSNFLSVGAFGNGTVNIGDGILTTNDSIIAERFGSGVVNVVGANAVWNNANTLTVGLSAFGGTGTLNITNGGRVTDTTALIGGLGAGQFEGGVGIATISGAGSIWLNTNTLSIGNDLAKGTVNISDGALVIAGTTKVGSFATQANLNISGTPGSRGILSTGQLTTAFSQNVNATFDGGILQATVNQTNFISGFNPGELVIATGGLFVDSQAFTVVANSVFSGIGGLTKLGSGHLILNGDQLYTGPTEVLDGQLTVNGRLSGNMLVGPNSRLSGNVTTGSTILQGVIAPGNSIGTIVVAGDYTQTAGSVYEAEINPLGQSDFIHVLGTATLEPGAGLFVLKEPGLYNTTHYTLLTADGGLTGTYSNFTQNMPLIDLVLSYDANNVYLDIFRNQTPIAFFGQTANQMNTAVGVESLGAGNPVYDALINLPDSVSINDALNRLSGEIYASSVAALVDESRYVRDALWTYLDNPAGVNTQQINGINFWTQAFGAWGRLDGNVNAAKMKRDTQGIFIGGDTHIGQQSGVGILGGYSQSDFRVSKRFSKNDIDNYHLGLYGYTRINQFTLNAAASYSWQDGDTYRNVEFPLFSNRLNASPDARTKQVFGEVGYLFDLNALSIKPVANLAYVDAEVDTLREAGGAASLYAQEASQHMTYSTLGAREKSLLYTGSNYNLSQRLFLGWQHAYDNLIPNTNLAFSSGSAAFSIYGTPLARNALVLDASLQAQHLSKNMLLSLAYFGQFSDQVRDQGVAARFSWHFA